jgi:hypothetical protein
MSSTRAIVKAILLSWIALTSADLLRAHRGWQADGLQQPLIEEDSNLYPPPVIMTLHSTKTQYRLEITTETQTRYVTDGSTSVPQAVRDWNTEQRLDACDPAACASCETWYRCFGKRSRWQVPTLKIDGSIVNTQLQLRVRYCTILSVRLTRPAAK